MTGLVAHKLQEVVYAALAADTLLMQRVTGVYDQPITGAAFPHVMMGDTTMSPGAVKDRHGARITFDILIWSNEPSQMETKELMALVDDVFQGNAMKADTFELVQIRLQNAGVVRQFNEEGSLYRGRLSYSATVYEREAIIC